MINGTLVIIGAGGHGRVAADVAALCGYEKILFLDDGAPSGVQIAGTTADFKGYLKNADFFVAIGSCAVREKIFGILEAEGAEIVSLIHPNAVVSPSAEIRRGAVVMAGAVVNCGAVIGRGAIINTCSSVDHDSAVGDFSHVSVGAHLAGSVTLGKRVFIGAGATVINNISVCDDCTVGAGAAVVKKISESGTYVGVPARRIK